MSHDLCLGNEWCVCKCTTYFLKCLIVFGSSLNKGANDHSLHQRHGSFVRGKRSLEGGFVGLSWLRSDTGGRYRWARQLYITDGWRITPTVSVHTLFGKKKCTHRTVLLSDKHVVTQCCLYIRRPINNIFIFFFNIRLERNDLFLTSDVQIAILNTAEGLIPDISGWHHALQLVQCIFVFKFPSFSTCPF